MTNLVRADRRSLRVVTDEDGNPTVDVFFDEHRVWSVKLPAPHPRTGERRMSWPIALASYLRGESVVAVRNSATGDEIGQADVLFGGAGRVEITDAAGRWLAMNKWDRLGPSFEGDSSGVQDRLLRDAAALAELMQQWGYPVYIVGSSLLGAMRTGQLLPHDDDIDFAFWSDRSDPEDLALISFELQRQLEAHGYTIVRHSHAHLEVVWFTDEGSTDYYVDIFTGYHGEDGLYNQPFALCDELPIDQLLPVKPIAVSGVLLPAPAVPEAWLAFAYGPDWLVPDPSFQWQTPRSTLRRFENCFGVFNRQRVFWEKTWQTVDTREPVGEHQYADVDRFLSMLPDDAFVVDLGCGDGRYAERIAAAGHQVLGVDYSHEALRVARKSAPDNVEYRFLNLNDRHELLRLTLELIDARRRPYFFARNLLHQMPQLARADLFVMASGLLDADSFVFATMDTTRPARRVVGNPETWTLTVPVLAREARRWVLGVTVIRERERATPYGVRDNATVLIWK